MTEMPPAAACDHRGCAWRHHERLLTSATVITLVRTVAAVAVLLAAAQARSLTLLLVGLAIHWVGDIADGAVARFTHCETRIGAVLDIICDRVCVGAFYVGLAWLVPGLALPVAVYLVEFAVVDTFCSLAFLSWPLVSPNYFHLVDRPTWLLNWSMPGKALNSSLVAVLMVTTRSAALSTAVALVLMAVKVWSLVRISRLGLPVPGGCAAASSTENTTDRHGPALAV